MDIQIIKTAVEFLKDGQSFKVDNLRMGMNTVPNMYVTGWSQYSNIENITRHQALKELNEVKILFKEMLDLSIELRSFIIDKRIEYNLYFDDFGRASIVICSEKDGDIKWFMNLK